MIKIKLNILFKNIIIYIKWKTFYFPIQKILYITQYILYDLVQNINNIKAKLYIKYIEFICFLNILKKDIKFDPNNKAIFYKLIKFKKFEIGT